MSRQMYAGGQSGRRVVPFSRVVAAGTGWTLEPWWPVPTAVARVVACHVLIPPGPAGLLHLRPVYLDGPGGQHYDLFDYPGGLDYLSGDWYTPTLHLAERLFQGRHSIGVEYRNTGALDHFYSVIYEVELGGMAHG